MLYLKLNDLQIAQISQILELTQTELVEVGFDRLNLQKRSFLREFWISSCASSA